MNKQKNIGNAANDDSARGVLKQTPKVSAKLRKPAPDMEEEVLGRDGLEPTRYGDWELDGKCVDF